MGTIVNIINFIVGTAWLIGLSILVLWAAFIPAANLVNRYKANRLNKAETFFGYIYVFLFTVLDVSFNFGPGAIIFWEFGSFKRKTLTARLKHYLRTEPESWRGKLAFFFCKYLISPWDWNHCGIGLGK